jgi:hypothetical protein
VYEVDTTVTKPELEDAVRRLGRGVLDSGRPYYMLIGGFDEDARELWEIPEVAALCQRIIDSGFIGLLGDNEELGRPGFVDARMCFALAKGSMVTHEGMGQVFQTEALNIEFIQALGAANETVDRLLAEEAPS